jgi:hypothetical protein
MKPDTASATICCAVPKLAWFPAACSAWSSALYVTQPVGITLQPVVILAMGVLFGLFGAWSSSMVGIAFPNSQLSQFEEEIEQGKVLLIVDIPRNRVDEVRSLIGRTHPEANARGFEPAYPVFP